VTAEAYGQVTALCELLLKADGLSASLMSLIEAALAVGDAETALGLAEDIRAASQLVAIENEAAIRSQIGSLVSTLEEIASHSGR
jgi:hypothetical protein